MARFSRKNKKWMGKIRSPRKKVSKLYVKNRQEVDISVSKTSVVGTHEKGISIRPKDHPGDLYDDYAFRYEGPRTSWEYDTTAPFFEVDEIENGSSEALIVSDEREMHEWKEDMLFVTAARTCLEANQARGMLETEFTELKTTHLDPPRIAPTIDQLEIGNMYADTIGGGWTTHEKGEMIDIMKIPNDASQQRFQINANHHLIIVANAFNFHDIDTNWKNRANITFTWTFTSGEDNYDVTRINEVVGNNRELSIENIQRRHIGLYTLTVSNEYGKKHSLPIEIMVARPGEVREEVIQIRDGSGDVMQEVLTNQKQWVPNDATYEHDEMHSVFDDKVVYNYRLEEWERIYYSPSSEKWFAAEGNMAYEWTSADEDGSYDDTEYSEEADSHSGKYWKWSDHPTVYYTDSQGQIAFSSEEQYYNHRESLGYSRDWRGIEERDR